MYDTIIRTRSLALLLVPVLILSAGCNSTSTTVDSDSEKVLEEFKDLVNSKNEKAKELLAPKPEVPKKPVSAKLVDRLDAEFFLHNSSYRVVSVRPKKVEGKPSLFVLHLKGKLSGEPYFVENGTEKPTRRQRLIVNPDVVVEVIDGKIRGVSAGIHEE